MRKEERGLNFYSQSSEQVVTDRLDHKKLAMTRNFVQGLGHLLVRCQYV